MLFLICLVICFCSLVDSLSPYEERNIEQKKSAVRQGQPLQHNFLDDYHFPMVADEVRNGLFYSALEKVVVRNHSKVLDVGAGTMLLSMMATDLGASKVVGVEANPLMCEVAREVLRVNNYTNDTTTGNIRLYEGRFESLYRSSKFMGKPADVFVSETFDSALIGENFLSILSHAKTHNLITPDAVVVPNSGTIFVQLLESSLSLPPGSSESEEEEDLSPFRAAGKYNLEPMRRHRPAGVYTVRHLDEPNAVRRRLSAASSLFDMDFQHFDPRHDSFGYTCLVLEVKERGVLDSLGLWFNLYLDQDKTLVLSNAPKTFLSPPASGAAAATSCAAPEGMDESGEEECQRKKPAAARSSCWMQALYRLPSDLHVRPGDFLRLQAVRLTSSFVFGEVSRGLVNSDARLVKFVAEHCVNDVQVYAFHDDKFEYIAAQEVPLSSAVMQSEYHLGTIVVQPPVEEAKRRRGGRQKKRSSQPESFTVLHARVHQIFKFSILLESGKRMGVLYQLPDSSDRGSSWGGSAEERARQRLPLDEHVISCSRG